MLQAYLLAVATCELSRASLAPLPGPGGICPLSVTLGYLQVWLYADTHIHIYRHTHIGTHTHAQLHYTRVTGMTHLCKPFV